MIDKILSKIDVKFLVVHCSATSDDQDLNSFDIHKMHLGFGWDGIGYHKVIRKNGRVENGRPEYWVGAHAKGFNKNSLGVCLIGKRNFTKAQFRSLYYVLKKWKFKYEDSKIIGHNEITISGKTCPNFNLKHWLKNHTDLE